MADDNVVSIATPGWDGVNAEPPTPPEYEATEQAEMDKAIARMFSSKDGKKVLDFLEKSFLHQPTWAPGFTTDYGFFREGQNTLIRELKARMKRAKERK
jgi:hypothetical protein|tara:strand:- start:6093 stop:6389 length:297 start_codon:yes stop_codon:yes gene_type:complete